MKQHVAAFPVMKALKEAYVQDWNPYSKKMISYISSKLLRKEVEKLQKQQNFLGCEGTFFIGITSGKLTNIFFDKFYTICEINNFFC